MKNSKILEAFRMRKDGYSLTQIEKATGIKRPYLSFMFQNFDYSDIIKIAETEPEPEPDNWLESLLSNEWGQITLLLFAIIGIISTILTLLKWI
jgi:uncharacterized membrane protein YkgB